MDKTLLTILACPNCKGSLSYQKSQQELTRRVCRLAYPIRDDIPVMLIHEARALAADGEI